MEAGPSKPKRGRSANSNNDDSAANENRRDKVPKTSRGIDPGPGCSTWGLPSDSDDESNVRVRNENLSQLAARDLGDSQRVRKSTKSPNAPRSGVIQKIHLKNFMCHSSMEITLNPHINFIVGRNGSGKSAILTALVVGLGGSACTTNRGSSLKQFIKNGMNSATIEITLNNSGRNAYKEEVFGEKIIVTRKLTEHGSSYTIKGSNGNIIYTKREELDQITSFMKVQVDNPISVLNQDTARSFLNSSNGREKYLLFMRATQLKLLWDIALKTIDSKRKAVNMLREKKAALEVTKKELDALELRWNQVKAVQDYRKKIIDLRATLNWALAAVEESNLKILQKAKTEQEALLPALQLAITNQSAEEKRLKEQSLSVEKRINDIREEAAGQEETHLESKKKVARCKEAYIRKLQSYKVLGVKVQRHETNVRSLRTEISKLQDGNESNSAEKRQQLQQQIATQENKFQEMTATQKTVDHHLAQLRGNENKYQEDLQQNRADLAECSRKVNKLKDQIAAMQSNTSNRLAVYGRYMPILVQKINEAGQQGKFRKLPLGPVGAYIQVKDKTWAPAIENFLGGFLRNFCVDNSDDHKELNKIFRSVLGEQRKPSIIISQFYSKVHNVSEFAVHAPHGMSSMLDALVVSNPVIANCLIDQRELESILLIPTSDEAVPLMREKRFVPHNCKRSITRLGEQFYPDPDYRTYGGDASSSAQYLQVNMGDLVRSKQDELANIEMRRTALQAEVNRLMDVLKENNVQMVQQRKDKMNLQQALLQLGAEIRALKDSEEPESASIATLLAELEESSMQLGAIKEEEKDLESECEFLKNEMEEAKDESVALRERARVLQGREQPLLVELENVREEIRELTAERGYRGRKLHDVQEKLKVINGRVAQQQELTDEALNLATEIHPERIETRKTPLDLDSEIKALERVIESVERETGDFTTVGTELNEKKTRYNNVSYNVENIDKALSNLDVTLEGRKNVYAKIQKYVSLSVNEMFAMMLREIGFTGEVKIDHVRQELLIEVQPSHRNSSDDTKTLSGGERSYSTVVFIMALWDVANPPFYFLDEFDVFMDKVNRRRTLEMLTFQAKHKKNSQFVFLTPQDLSSVAAGNEVSIHRMGNPRDES